MAIVNGFDTKALARRLAKISRYEIYELYGDYYIIDGVMMVCCDYDVIEKIKDYLGMIVPEEKHGWRYDTSGGWEEVPIENIDTYFKICGVNWDVAICEREREVVANNIIEINSKPAIEYLLSNGETVTINKAYFDIMAPAKKWGWNAKGRGSLDALHFRNRVNESEMWIMPIRRSKREVA